MLNVLFYKYVELDDPQGVQKQQMELCRRLNLLGKILISKEGINGNFTGSDEESQQYMQEMWKDPLFSDIDFKVASTHEHNFSKLFVRIRDEIVSYAMDADVKNKAAYIEPQELKEMLGKKEEVILVDVRNRYEYELGHFDNAIRAEMDISKQWPIAAQQLEKFKDKTIVTYCTGGVRCEKATAYLRQQGFGNIRQLHGGIIKYGMDCGNEHWKGKCFVFDTRGVVDIDPNNQAETIARCHHCHMPAERYYNCRLVSCDKRTILCSACLDLLDGCCSKRCRNEFRKEVGERSSRKDSINA